MGDGRWEIKFEDLRVWQGARKIVSEVYALTREDRLVRDFGLTSQIQRAAVSTMTNLAERFERIHVKEKLQFYNVARVSMGKVRSLLYVIIDNYEASSAEADRIQIEVTNLGKAISGPVKSTNARKP